MPGIYMAMEIARKALYTNQMAMQVTSHNVANANTPGYSRQGAVISESNAMTFNPGQLGMGAQVMAISRSVDVFTDNQLLAETATYSGLDYTARSVGQVEAIFNDNNGASLADRVNEFYHAWDDLAANPQGTAERQTVVSTAELLTSEFRRVDQQVATLKENANKDIQSLVGEINQLVDQIANLNGSIKINMAQGMAPNDLMDQRQELLKQLGQKIGYTTVTDEYGQINVYVGKGRALVDGENTGRLYTDINTSTADLLYDVKIQLPGQKGDINQWDTITHDIVGGQMASAVSFRDGYINTVRDRLDQLAYAITNQTNATHVVGYGLPTGTPPVAVTGNAFFTPFTGIENSAKNFQVDASVLGDIRKVAAAGATKASANVVFTGVPQTATAPRPSITVGTDTYDFYDSSLGAYAGANVGVDLNGATTAADVASRLAAASVGANYTLEARGGMLLAVATADGAAGNAIALSTAGSDLANAINVSGPTFSGGVDFPTSPPPVGDNRNAVLFSGLGNTKVDYLQQGATVPDFIAGMIGQIGSETKGVDLDLKHQRVIVDNLETRRETVSGVSLDEEMTNLIKFQRAFEASTKMIAIVDQLLNQIISMKSNS
jgi:flagellar hook-associated protein 1 FlgK